MRAQELDGKEVSAYLVKITNHENTTYYSKYRLQLHCANVMQEFNV